MFYPELAPNSGAKKSKNIMRGGGETATSYYCAGYQIFLLLEALQEDRGRWFRYS